MKRIINTLIAAAACLLPAAALAATTVTLNPVADAYVQGGNKAAVNYGTATELRAQTHNSASSNYDSYLRFDTGTGQVTSARLRLYTALSGSGSVATSAYAVSDTTWNETAITWNTKPALGASLGSVTIASTAYAWQEIDVTAYVQSERAAGRSIISLGLHNAATSSVTLSANSREAANPPQLVVVTNDAPTASLTAPITGSVYTAPASVTLTAGAADADGSIASVEFYNGTTLIGAGTLTGGSYTLDWTSIAAGSYSLTARATDNLGAVTVSAPVTITVNPPNVPPSVSLTSPADGSSYTAPASITLSADATDGDGSIASVEFYDGTTLIASLTAPPYSYTWNDVPAGSHSLTAKATDNQGTASTSAPVTISVNAVLASGVYYIYTDHLNTPRVITDSSNRTVWRWDSDPFGATTANEDPDGDGAKFTYNLRFPGQYYDRETNLHYNYFRDYDPTTGKYVQSDPIGLAGGSFSTYSYVDGKPLSSVDPFGLANGPAVARLLKPGSSETSAAEVFTGLVTSSNFPGSSCGPEGDPNNFPNNWTGNYEPACKRHDWCYSQCGVDKKYCDDSFYEQMLYSCEKIPASSDPLGTKKSACRRQAWAYRTVVDNLGQKAFDKAQEHCQCKR